MLGATRRALCLGAGAPQAARAGRPPTLPAMLLRLPQFAAPRSGGALASRAPEGGLLRRMSTGAPGQVAGSDGSDLDSSDPYMPHRLNYENAKAYIRENVKKGMSDDDVAGEYLWKVMCIVTLYSKSTSALTFQRFCQRLSSEPWSSTFPRSRRSRCSVSRVHQQSLECSALDSCTHAHEDHCAHAKLARCFHTARARHEGDDPAPPDPEAARSRSCSCRCRRRKNRRSKQDYRKIWSAATYSQKSEYTDLLCYME